MVMARPGQMRHRMTVQVKSMQTNHLGERFEQWLDLYSDVPVSVRWLTARELQAASARQSHSTVEFELRPGLDITSEHRIVWQGRVYELEPPLFDRTTQRRMRIRASEGVTNG